ncbi:unnamed protein product [Adineta steineri]|uniref:non-specific serine/threonine protein kinase n=1 Tax=Adineta steineri TaxID=433720 RepID=A0A819KXG3_9BILA|nr:unnamed protein product [Adineta steineri]CAF3952090.1 unnamed protein product [Adineta steineri]
MTKSSHTFCTVLKTHPDVLDQLRQCCFEEDSHVRKMAFFVLGNFISTNEILYEYVDELTPFLVQALNDTISKIRSHAVNTLGFLARYRRSERLINFKVPEKLLDVACHDTHVIVQEFALRVLKQMLKHERAKEILQECNATDKLSNLLSNLCIQMENNQYSEVDGLADECEELLKPNECDIILDSKELRQHEYFIHLSSKHFIIECLDNGRSIFFRDVSRNGCYNDENRAYKFIHLSGLKQIGPGPSKYLYREVSIHESVDVYHEKTHLFVEMEYAADGGALLDRIHKTYIMDEDECKLIFYQIGCALAYLHRLKILK